MRFSITTILALPAVTTAFVQTTRPAFRTGLSMSDVITGPEGKAASSAEEDLMLTLRIIMDHEERSSTVTKEQMLSQVSDAQEVEDEEVDVSIPYDAPAKLAYEASDKSVAYPEFKEKYEADAVAGVIAKKNGD